MGTPQGDHLGPYRLLSRLGAGGFGEVHLALDPEGRTVAVKVLHPHVAADTRALARLAREVEAMRRVRGRHIAEVLDASLDGRSPYLVTRYIQGRPLNAVVAVEGPVHGEELVRLARGLSEALMAIHESGVIHRDLKPSNVILADGEPVVIDFGIAAVVDSASVTASGAVLGTPGYLAPEVLEGQETRTEGDIFAFAATLAFAATGREPYGTGSVAAIGYRVVHHEPDLEGVPDWLAAVLRDCLAPDPAARPTAGEIHGRLPGVVGAAGPPPPKPRSDTFSRARIPVAPPAPAAGPAYAEPPPARSKADPLPPPVSGSGGDVHSLSTREWRPGQPDPRPPAEVAMRRRRARVRLIWIIGTGVVAALGAAAARSALPEVSLLLLAAYGSGVAIDAAVGLFARKDVGRALLSAGSGVGAVALFFLLSSIFSTFTLALAFATVIVVLVVLVVAG
ncbi:Serine/threonine protein kinase [Sinosporangium album]|uniref:Serine/threonine protein kinase n=1 Tax=Sinosporangium album TaxID=504805 RepID=A0A1G8F5W7_9ACTN|nr:serine/threonine-protein kinase [Sinosporangium album]SDH77514.1 Serine/threonine protein kinase [Sinosporangium album]